MRKKSICRVLLLASLVVTPSMGATIFIETLPGTNAPPMMLGGYFMEKFPTEVRPEFDMVVDAAAPAGGALGFSDPLDLNYVGSGWDTWSHGYTGAVYTTFGTALSLQLPADTQAFYLYLQPMLKDTFEFTVDAQGTTTTLTIDGDGGARYLGIYIDDPSMSLTGLSILDTTGMADGFAIGEFGVDSINPIPEPGSLIALGGVLASGLMLRHRRRNA